MYIYSKYIYTIFPILYIHHSYKIESWMRPTKQQLIKTIQAITTTTTKAAWKAAKQNDYLLAFFSAFFFVGLEGKKRQKIYLKCVYGILTMIRAFAPWVSGRQVARYNRQKFMVELKTRLVRYSVNAVGLLKIVKKRKINQNDIKRLISNCWT